METQVKNTDWLSTGSTLLNLALSGHPDRGFAKGKYFWIVGDSSSGKTFLTLTCFAEAAANAAFDGYDLIFDNAEDGALMDLRRYFGQRMADRLQAPDTEDGLPVYSETVEDFYFHLDKRLQAVEAGKSQPFVYLLDSMDALSSKYEGQKFAEKRREWEGGAKAKGDYGDGKAKMNSTYIRRVVARLRGTGCILLVLSQTRDNIDAGMFEPKSTHAGGRALKFYATCQLWSSVGGRLHREVRGTKRQTGITCRVAIKKNRLTGKEWTVQFPIMQATGIDDVGACVDYLIAEGVLKKKGATIDAGAVFDGCKGNREKVVAYIEEHGLESDLRGVVADTWADVEQATALKRKPRYE
jgi:recombination protein RecA